jgi:hypothetical protein
VAHGRRLGRLEVRKARHDGFGVAIGGVGDGFAGLDRRRDGVEDVGAQPMADAGRDLVVAGAGGVHPAAALADALDDGRLDGRVDVLAVGEGGVARGLDVGERLEDRRRVRPVDDVLLVEHHDVGAVHGDVGGEDALVGRETRHEPPGRAAAEALAADDVAVRVRVPAVPVVVAGHESTPRCRR